MLDQIELLQRLDTAISRTAGEPQQRLIAKRALVESGEYIIRDVTAEVVTEAAAVIGQELSRWTKAYLTSTGSKRARAFRC